MAYIDNVTNILQIQPDGLPTFVRLSQNENGRNLYFQLAGNEIDIPSNATVTISGTKPDGNVYSGTGSVSDNVVLIPEMLQMTAVAGTWDAKVKITSGGNTIATGRVRFVVDADTVDPDAVPSSSELEGLVAEAQQYAETARTEAYGSPLTASAAADMTDHTRVYVYTGSETGYTAGHWYYWDGSAWTDGGIYNSVAVNTDPTLTLTGVAADAKAAGDAIDAAVSDLKSDLKSAIDYTRDATADAYGVNFFDPFALIPNKDLGTNGVAVDSQIYDITDFIDVGNNTKCTFKLFDYTGSVSFTIYLYSSNTEDSFIKRAGNGSYLPGRTLNLDSGTKYIRFRVEKSSANHINPYKIMCVWGETTISAFVPYYTAWDKTARTSYNDLDSRALQNRINAGITDANAITDVGYYYLSANIVDNLPETSGAWWLWNTKLNTNNMLQQAFEAHGYRTYMRAKVSGSWRTWEQIATDTLVKSRFSALSDTSSISLFETVGCCGDSFTAGYLYNKPDSQWYDPNYAPTGAYPRISYGKVMGRLYGLDVSIYAKGGLTSTAWRTDSTGLPALRADDPKDLYIICLGLNDCTNNKVPLGVQADLDTEPAEPTWYGNMGVIIRSIQSHAPMSRIVLLKSPWVYRTVGGNVNSHYTYNSEAIEYIKQHLGIPYLETLGDPYFCGTEYIEGVEAHGLHPTAPLYAGMGRRIGELVGKCIIDNPEYFYNFYIAN